MAHKGKKLSKEHYNAISKGSIGRKHSEETKRKMSVAKQGYVPWNTGLTKEIDSRVAKNYIKRL